jgi:hypothetical protein
MANVWRDPIYDRTLEDVEFAIRKLKEWKQSHTHVTDIRVENDALVVRDESTAYVDSDKFVLQGDGVAYVDNDVLIVHVGDVYELKGCFNLLDLNRIESNIAFLAEKMESFSYSPNIHGKQWGRTDMPNQNDMSRIVDNIRSLIDSFYPPDKKVRILWRTQEYPLSTTVKTDESKTRLSRSYRLRPQAPLRAQYEKAPFPPHRLGGAP